MTATIVLDSGVGVTCLERRDVAVAALVVTTGVGSCEDPVGLSGTAHLTEHLLFRQDDVPYVRRAAALGADSGGVTGRGSMASHDVVPTEGLRALVPLAAGRWCRERLDTSAFASERSVVLAEVAASVGGLRHPWEGLVSPDERGGRSRLPHGAPEQLVRVTRDDCQAYFARAARPESVNVVVCGDVREAEVVDQVAEAFAGLGSADAPTQASATAEVDPEIASPRRSGTRALHLFWPGSQDPARHAAATVLTQVVARHYEPTARRLVPGLRSARLGLGFQDDPRAGRGPELVTFRVEGETCDDDVEAQRAEGLLRTVLGHVAHELPDERVVAVARHASLDHASGRTSPLAAALETGRAVALGHPPSEVVEDLLSAVDGPAVRALAAQWCEAEWVEVA